MVVIMDWMTVRCITRDAVMFYRDWDITLYDEWHYVWICLRETVIIILNSNHQKN